MEDDLLAALKELKEASLNMTSGQLPSADDMERFHRAIEVVQTGDCTCGEIGMTRSELVGRLLDSDHRISSEPDG